MSRSFPFLSLLRRNRLPAMLLVAVVFLVTVSCGRNLDERSEDGRIVLHYWEKWTGFEGDAMKAVVDDYNKSQDRVFVKMSTVSGIDRKLLVAVAGGDPPDIAGIWSWAVNIYSDKGAIMPITERLAAVGIKRENYVPVFWDLCSHRGKTWALPSTVATVALHINRRLLREAGIDPNYPPKTIAELNAMNDTLTIYELSNGERKSYNQLGGKPPADAKIIQMGFLPFEPGWFDWAWGHWFHGQLWNGKDKITSAHVGNVAAMKWYQYIMRRYGPDQIELFFNGFRGNFATSTNAFFCGKIAMVMQGVWMYNFIDKYSSGMDWAAAPIPSVDGEGPVTIVECDVLAIPTGCRHPEEAFEFIRYVNSQAAMEKLAMGQRKFSPLVDVTPEFYAKHPNQYIKLFRQLAESPWTCSTPASGIWNEYQRELNNVIDQVRRLKIEPEAGLTDLQAQMQDKLDREIVRLKRRGMIEP
ncbi:MAG: ABC transporter substrate-binding protein [Candidatus Hydrogenedentota bacterium]